MPSISDLLAGYASDVGSTLRNLLPVVSSPDAFEGMGEIVGRTADLWGSNKPITDKLLKTGAAIGEGVMKAPLALATYSPEAEAAILGPRGMARLEKQGLGDKIYKYIDLLTGQNKGSISDAGATLKLQNLEKNPYSDNLYGVGGYNTKQTIGDLLDHPDLYAAYPWMKDMPVSRTPLFNALGGTAGAYGGGKVYLSGAKPEEMMQTLLHEIQHVIQKTEKMPGGGSPSDFMQHEKTITDSIGLARKMESDAIDQIKAKFPDFNRFSSKVAPEVASSPEYQLYKSVQGKKDELESYVNDAYQKYRRVSGEADARAVANMRRDAVERAFMGPRRPYSQDPRLQNIKASRHPYDYYDVPVEETFIHRQTP